MVTIFMLYLFINIIFYLIICFISCGHYSYLFIHSFFIYFIFIYKKIYNLNQVIFHGYLF